MSSTGNMSVAVTAEELHVMVHATAWRSGKYRNYYLTGRGSDAWPVLMALVEKGLVSQDAAPEDPRTMTAFRVTDAGYAFLRKAMP